MEIPIYFGNNLDGIYQTSSRLKRKFDTYLGNNNNTLNLDTNLNTRMSTSLLNQLKKRKKKKYGQKSSKTKPNKKQLYKMIKFEKKYIDYFRATSLDTSLSSGAFLCFHNSAIAQGTGSRTRIGNQVQLWSLQYKIECYQPKDYVSAKKPGACNVRFLWILDMMPSGVSLPVEAEIFAPPIITGGGSTTFYAPNMFLLPENKRFKILKEEVCDLDAVEGQLIVKEGYFKINKPLEFNDRNGTSGVYAYARKNAILLVIYCQNKTIDFGTAQDYPLYTVNSRLTYYDV